MMSHACVLAHTSAAYVMSLVRGASKLLNCLVFWIGGLFKHYSIVLWLWAMVKALWLHNSTHPCPIIFFWLEVLFIPFLLMLKNYICTLGQWMNVNMKLPAWHWCTGCKNLSRLEHTTLHLCVLIWSLQRQELSAEELHWKVSAVYWLEFGVQVLGQQPWQKMYIRLT